MSYRQANNNGMDNSFPREQGLDPKYVFDPKHWQRSSWDGDKGRYHHVSEFDVRGRHYEEEMYRDFVRRIEYDIHEVIVKYKE